jgi:transposase
VSKYSSELKLEVVRAYIDGGIGSRALGNKYLIDHHKIRQWAKLYKIHGSEGLTKKFSNYPAAFKLKVLRRMWEGRLSFSETAAIFNIRNPWCLSGWERLYREGGIEALKPRQRGRRKAMVDPKVKPPPKGENDRPSREELLAELSQLRMENAYLKKLNALVQARQAPKKRK